MTAPDRSEFTPGILQQIVSLDGANGQIPLLPSWDQGAAEELLKLLYVKDNPKIDDPLADIFTGLRSGIPLVLAIIEAIVQRLLGGGPVFLNITHALTSLTTWWNDVLAILGNPAGIGSGSLDLDAIWTSIIENLITPTGLLATLAEMVDAIFEAITGVPRGDDDPLMDLQDVLRHIPFLNVLGIGGPGDIGGSMQQTWDQLISGFVGQIGSGTGLSDLFNISQLVSSRATLGEFSWDILGIRSNKSLITGLLPTSESNFGLDKVALAGAAPTFPLTQSTAITAFQRISESASKGVVSWLGSGVTNITDAFVNIFRMDTSTGVMTLVHQSANIVGNLSGSMQYNLYQLPTPITVQPGEVYGIEIAVRGAGTHNIVGASSWLPDHFNVFPRRLSAVRNSGTSAPPSFITTGSVSYTSNVPFVEFGVSAGNVSMPHTPQTFLFNAAGNSSMPIPSWANIAERVALGGGGGGRQGGTFGISGEGGDNGTWVTGAWLRGTDFTGTPSISVTVGAGGVGGTGVGASGGNTVVSIPGSTVTATGGAGGDALTTIGSDSAGQSPGNITFGGITYSGGGTQSTFGGNGAAPGGGGAGGNWLSLQSGGNGAPGAVWLRFKQ